MKKWQDITSKTIVLNLDNIDTDMIIPAQYLTSISKTGYGEGLFKRLRDENPEFPLNHFKPNECGIIVAGANFGCGSSREHAVWALMDYGFSVVIAKSFGDIFYANSLKNGLLPIIANDEMHREISEEGEVLTISLQKQEVLTSKNLRFNFEIDTFRRDCILQGQDDLDYILNSKDQIRAFRENQNSNTFLDTHWISER